MLLGIEGYKNNTLDFYHLERDDVKANLTILKGAGTIRTAFINFLKHSRSAAEFSGNLRNHAGLAHRFRLYQPITWLPDLYLINIPRYKSDKSVCLTY
jgi:hypothetical protein